MSIEKQTGGGTFEANVDDEEAYPGINVKLDGELIALAECYEQENQKMMMHVYSKENEEPISINIQTGEVVIPEEWQGKISLEKRGFLEEIKR